jgi:hypothetical protein
VVAVVPKRDDFDAVQDIATVCCKGAVKVPALISGLGGDTGGDGVTAVRLTPVLPQHFGTLGHVKHE